MTTQVTVTGHHKTRYDITLLINGLPLVQIELKRRVLELEEAFNQINRYQRHSDWSESGLFQYVQLFVISNGVNTKYYANVERRSSHGHPRPASEPEHEGNAPVSANVGHQAAGIAIGSIGPKLCGNRTSRWSVPERHSPARASAILRSRAGGYGRASEETVLLRNSVLEFSHSLGQVRQVDLASS